MVISKVEEKVLLDRNCCAIELVCFVEESPEGAGYLTKQCSRVL